MPLKRMENVKQKVEQINHIYQVKVKYRQEKQMRKRKIFLENMLLY